MWKYVVEEIKRCIWIYVTTSVFSHTFPTATLQQSPLTLRGGEFFFAFPEGLEPSCCHAATSERRRIKSRADNNIIALRGASVRRSQRGNNEAIVGEMGGKSI